MDRFSRELGSDNGKELHNKLIENYLNEKNIMVCLIILILKEYLKIS